MSVEAAPPRPATQNAIALWFISPCMTEEKDQDRATLVRQSDGWVAVLCDGTSQSMYSADAADLVTLDPFALWGENGVSDVAARLEERRAKLIADAKDEEPDPSSFLAAAMAKFMRRARETSYQTTMVTARVTPAEAGRFVVEAKSIGDSALLIFDAGGELLYSNLHIPDRDSGFGHMSSITEVLPDHFRSDDVARHLEVDAGAHVVLCSDGFYEAFGTPRELLQWLIDCEDELRAHREPPAIDELHVRLDRRIGDDDLSFIWLCPRTAPGGETALAATTETASPPSISIVSRLYRMLLAFIRRLRTLWSRFASGVHGENAS